MAEPLTFRSSTQSTNPLAPGTAVEVFDAMNSEMTIS
jgi:hypothetical protein